MTFPTYEQYQGSGYDWLGSVPSHWTIKRLKFIFSESREINGNAPVGTMLSVSGYRGVEIKRYDHESQRRTDEEVHGYRVVRPGQLAVNTMWLNYTGLGVSGVTGHVSPAYRVYGIGKDMSPRYAHYLLRSKSYVDGYTKYLQGIRPNSLQMKTEDFESLPVLLPDHTEQECIADFLDHETARIDVLIEEQQRLVDLLAEERDARITHAVTRGLDATTSTRDSGLDWLGEIPAHWEVRKISTVTDKVTNGYVGPTRDALKHSGVRYLQSLHIKRNQIKFDPPYYVDEQWSQDHSKSILREGDVLVVQTGDIGQVAYVPGEFAGANCHALIILSPITNVLDGRFLSWVLNSSYGFNSLKSVQTGALHPHLNCGYVRDIYIPVPPIQEQSEIARYIEETEREFDGLVGEILSGETLLKERRTAVISAAVTGKIDVRERRHSTPSAEAIFPQAAEKEGQYG